jgi:hypothetical protein
MVVRKLLDAPRLVQFMMNGTTLYALDFDGRIWRKVYNERNGWHWTRDETPFYEQS